MILTSLTEPATRLYLPMKSLSCAFQATTMPLPTAVKRMIFEVECFFTFFSWNGKTFTDLPGKTGFKHRQTRLLSYRNSPLAVGDTTGNKVEILEFGIWDELEVYPYHN